MSHFSVVVCTEDPAKLDALMAPYDENLEVAPYRDYKCDEPSGHWAVKHLREENGLNPDDATLTWQQVADAYMKAVAPHFSHSTVRQRSLICPHVRLAATHLLHMPTLPVHCTAAGTFFVRHDHIHQTGHDGRG